MSVNSIKPGETNKTTHKKGITSKPSTPKAPAAPAGKAKKEAFEKSYKAGKEPLKNLGKIPSSLQNAIAEAKLGKSQKQESESEEKTTPSSDKARLHEETHTIIEKLKGNTISSEEEKYSDGSISKRDYKKQETEDGLIFKEKRETTYNEGKYKGKKDNSSTTITRKDDGSYTKEYKRTDANGNHYKTTLEVDEKGNSNRVSETTRPDGTKITSKEMKDKDGKKEISSDETRPDGTTVHKEKIIELDGTSKMISEETRPDGTTVKKKETVDENGKKKIETEQLKPDGTLVKKEEIIETKDLNKSASNVDKKGRIKSENKQKDLETSDQPDNTKHKIPIESSQLSETDKKNRPNISS